MEPEAAQDEATGDAPNVYIICSMSEIPSQRARGFQLMRVDENGENQPLNIVVVRWGKQVFGYENLCPHNKVNLDWERHQFLDSNGIRLMCGKHGAIFEIGTGACLDGPCKGESLTPVPLVVLDNEICLVGIELAEDIDDDEEEITSCSDEGGGV